MSQEKYLQFRVDYCVNDGAIFLLFRAKLLTGKFDSQEISNILPPCFRHKTVSYNTDSLIFVSINRIQLRFSDFFFDFQPDLLFRCEAIIVGPSPLASKVV